MTQCWMVNKYWTQKNFLRRWLWSVLSRRCRSGRSWGSATTSWPTRTRSPQKRWSSANKKIFWRACWKKLQVFINPDSTSSLLSCTNSGLRHFKECQQLVVPSQKNIKNIVFFSIWNQKQTFWINRLCGRVACRIYVFEFNSELTVA